MTFKKYIQLSFIIITVLISSQKSFAQCFQIESILVDACGPAEGLNEMVRFKIGPVAQNVSNLSVVWPNNLWQGVIQNATTVSKTATLNADILAAGGCGQLIEPTGGVLPANANVILVTSYNLDTALNSFGALTQNIYIIYQNNPAVASGHFANSGTGLRTLVISFGACSDTVTYDRALLVDTAGNTTAADGATVQFAPDNTPTYINNGCSAPVDPFTVDAGPVSVNSCAGATIALTGTAEGQTSVHWSAPSGTFSSPNSLATNYTLSASATGTIPLTLTATNSCGATVTDVINVIIVNSVTPNFTTPLTICAGSTAPTLNTTSPNGITGTWLPSTVSNTTSGDYIFTPTAGQCASSFTLHVNVTNSIAPNFTTPLTICTASTAPTLNTTSPNGIAGTWLPSTVSNTTSGDYIFTPTAGQCASNFTLHVDVTNSISPNFTTPLTICSGSTAPTLNTTSPNGIAGTWLPSTVGNTASGDYIFTATAGQCASNFTLHVNVTNSTAPNFTTPLTICNGSTAPSLNTTSPNGIAGTWLPSTVSNTASGDYIFTATAGQCASNFTLHVNVTNSTAPNFTTPLTICNGSSAPSLNTTSPNGITGTWLPSTVSNTASGDYIFTATAGQCASNFTLHVNVTNTTAPTFTAVAPICSGDTLSALPTTSNNGVTGAWSPALNTTATTTYTFIPDAGQCASSATLEIVVNPLPQFTLSEGCNGVSYVLSAVQTNPAGSSYVWQDPSNTLIGSDATVAITAPGLYTLVLTQNGCSTSGNINVLSTLCNIQKGISVNNDGLNDDFDLTAYNVADLKIFNRYGIKVYEKANYNNEWQGQSDKGDELPDGTYYYVINFQDIPTKTGWIYINRAQ